MRIREQEYGRSRREGQGWPQNSLESPGRNPRGWGAFVLFILLLLPEGCTPPDRPGRLPGSLPAEFLNSRAISSSRAFSPVQGLAYFGVISPEGPWAIHLVRVDLNRCDLGLEILKAPRQEGRSGGRSRVSEMEEVREGRVLAAVNGDFFTPEGISVGTEVVDGVVSRVRNRPALAWRPGDLPWMGIPGLDGDSVLVLGWRLLRSRSDSATLVVGGFPLLLRDGGRAGDLGVGDLPSFSAARHPRTAVGLDRASRHLWLVVVDGRQPGYSDGMTLPELAKLFQDLGVTDAVNLDGGGSAVMVLEGVRVSRPSDQEGERPVVNALGVARNPAFCRVGGGPPGDGLDAPG